MFLYNLTIHIEWPAQEEFLNWIKLEVLPELMEKNYFQSFQLMELLGMDEKEGNTYALQLSAESIGGYNRFMEIYQENFFKKFSHKWGEKCFIFPSLLKEISLE